MHKKQLIIWVLASVLITYHTIKIYAGLVATDDAANAVLNWSVENSARLLIIFSLLLVIMFKRLGLIFMWLSVCALMVYEIIYLPETTNMLAYISPLKETLIPAIITWLFSRQSNHLGD